MDKRWLTEELDNTPYTYDEEKLENYIKDHKIEEKRDKVKQYFKAHPEAYAEILSHENQVKRFNKEALTFLNLEGLENFDICNISEEQANKLRSYREACELAHDLVMQQREHFVIDQNAIIRIHRQLCSGDPDRNLYSRYSYRGPQDRAVIVGRGCFIPVDGKDVDMRMSMLLYHLYEHKNGKNDEWVWADDNVFAKGAKFVTEYVRIQPHMDGNKRMALILNNCILESSGYTDIYFNNNQIDEIHEALKEGLLTRDVTNLALIFARSVDKRYESLWDKVQEYAVEQKLASIDKEK